MPDQLPYKLRSPTAYSTRASMKTAPRVRYTQIISTSSNSGMNGDTTATT